MPPARLRLLEKPEAEEQKSRNVDAEEDQKTLDVRLRKHHDVRSHYRRKRATRSHCRHLAAGVEINMTGSGGEPAQQVKDDEGPVTDACLDIVGKDPHVHHVAQQVHPASVQKSTGDQKTWEVVL